MVQAPYGNCISWLKKEFSNVERRKIMFSERATPLRDISFGIRFLAKNVVSFFFTLFFFILFLLQARKKRKQLAFSAVENLLNELR